MRKDYSLFQAQAELYKNYGFDFVHEIKNSRFSEDKLGFRKEYWSFTRYSPERVAHLFHNWKKCFGTPEIPLGVKQAYEQELSLLEVCKGNYDDPNYIPITDDLDIETLKECWYQNYCCYHLFPIRKEPGRAYEGNGAFLCTSRGKFNR